MDQRRHDYEVITAAWELWKEFDGITTDQEERWEIMRDRIEELNQKYKAERGIFREVGFILNERAVAANKGELKNA